MPPEPEATASVGLPSRRVWELAGLPPSTLNYWVQIGLVKPSYRGPSGRRVEQWWSVRDVVVVRTIKAMRDAGVPLQQVRQVKKTLDRWEGSLADARLRLHGTDVEIEGPEGDLVSGASEPGQGVLYLMGVPIGRWYTEAEQAAVPVDIDDFKASAKKRAALRKKRSQPMQRLLRPS